MKSVLELGVNTGQWDAGLKKAGSALNNFVKANGGLQQALQKDDEKIASFVQMMGKMESTATTAKGRMNDYKRTIEQLTEQYNRMDAAQQKAIGTKYTAAIDQLTTKYRAAAAEVQKLNASLSGGQVAGPKLAAGGSTLIDSALSVLGGNLMTKGVMVLSEFAAGMGEMVKQGVELAKAGEGVYNAFQRLNNPTLLDELRKATHGTVSDLELMKAAVKFNDFKLPLSELGTMLAFAQQKAKDTGQSVDYMVDSIVTGLGRKSKLILDNLGISASELTEKMKSTGDMTKAVGEIVREQMAKAGDYVETAADRATQANVRLTNAITELGRTFQPLSESANTTWTNIKIGALDVLNNAVKPLIRALAAMGKYDMNVGAGTFGGMTDADRQKAESYYNEQKASGKTDQSIIADAEGTIKTLNDEKDKITKAWEEYQAAKENGNWKVKHEARQNLASVLGISLQGRNEADAVMQALNARNTSIDYQNYLTTLATPAPKIETTTELSDSEVKKQLATKEAQYEEQEKIQIASLDRQAMNETEYEQKVYEIKKEWMQKTALLYDEGTQERAQANSKLLDLEIQHQNNLAKAAARLRGNMVTGIGGYTSANIAALRKEIQDGMGGMQMNSTEYVIQANRLVDLNTFENLLKVATQNGLEIAPSFLEDLFERLDRNDINLGLNIEDSEWQELVRQINEHLKALNLPQIKLNVNTGQVSDATKDVKAMNMAWMSAAQAIGQVGGAMQSLEDPTAKIAGIVAQAIAQVALGLGEMLAQPQSTAQSWGWIGLAATGTATMISTIAAIRSVTSSNYAHGGRIEGNSYSGDNMRGILPSGELIGLDAGEIVLNHAQQTNVARDLQGGGGAAIADRPDYVTGENIVLGVNNHLKRIGKGEIVTTAMLRRAGINIG